MENAASRSKKHEELIAALFRIIYAAGVVNDSSVLEYTGKPASASWRGLIKWAYKAGVGSDNL